jgi:hypothetical protein
MNQLFLFSGPSGDNFRVNSRLPTTLGVDISSFRQRDAFVMGKMEDIRVSEDIVERMRQSFLRSPKKSVCHASREL